MHFKQFFDIKSSKNVEEFPPHPILCFELRHVEFPPITDHFLVVTSQALPDKQKRKKKNPVFSYFEETFRLSDLVETFLKTLFGKK